jgi:hypothetical protein
VSGGSILPGEIIHKMNGVAVGNISHEEFVQMATTHSVEVAPDGERVLVFEFATSLNSNC